MPTHYARENLKTNTTIGISSIYNEYVSMDSDRVTRLRSNNNKNN